MLLPASLRNHLTLLLLQVAARSPHRRDFVLPDGVHNLRGYIRDPDQWAAKVRGCAWVGGLTRGSWVAGEQSSRGDVQGPGQWAVKVRRPPGTAPRVRSGYGRELAVTITITDDPMGHIRRARGPQGRVMRAW